MTQERAGGRISSFKLHVYYNVVKKKKKSWEDMSFSNSRVVIPVENKIISLERRAGAYLIFIRNTHIPWSMRLGVAVLSSTNCCTALELRDTKIPAKQKHLI